MKIIFYQIGKLKRLFWALSIQIVVKGLIISMVDAEIIEYMSLQNNFQGKMYIMKIHKFGCTDVIESIKRQSTVDQIEFCGSGYSDQALFNQTKCKITYSFQEIKEYLIKNNVKTVINTWGKRNNPREFRESIDDFESFCSNENINFIRQCPSPSGRLRGKENKQILTKFYKTHLLQPCP
jgi:hypothetical protein